MDKAGSEVLGLAIRIYKELYGVVPVFAYR
jgi:hypothetical protein